MKKTKYHSLDKISQKEFLKLFQGPTKKLLDYAGSQKIKVKPLRKILKVIGSYLRKKMKDGISQNIPYWACSPKKKIIYADIRDLELNSRKERTATAWTFAHEISHVQCRNNFPIICPYSWDNNCACPFEEYYCHQKGLELIKKLKIPVNEKGFWDFALRFTGVHDNFCLDFETCDYFDKDVKREHKNRILFWQKEKQKGKEREILKDYLLKQQKS